MGGILFDRQAFGIAGDTFVLSTVVCGNIKNEEQNVTLKSIQITARKFIQQLSNINVQQRLDSNAKTLLIVDSSLFLMQM